jgi:CheY-like chemotaxis protein
MDKVLVADDDKILLGLITNFLEKYSDKLEVVTAQDGQEAIHVLKREAVSVLVTDIQMPRLDGLDLLAYVSVHHPNLACFVMSAHGTPQMKAKLPRDLVRFFQKPFEMEDLARAIIETLDRNISQAGVQGISQESILHMIEMEQSSCIFEIKSPGKDTGMLYFVEGVLFDAECGDLKGEAAAHELLARETTTFKFKFFTPKGMPRQIKPSLDKIIQKANEEKKKSDPDRQFHQKRYKFT